MAEEKKVDKTVQKNLKSQFVTLGERQKYVKAMRQELEALGIGEINPSENPDAKNNWWLVDADDQKLAEIGFDKDMVRFVVYSGQHAKEIESLFNSKGFEGELELGKKVFKNFDDNFKSPLEPEEVDPDDLEISDKGDEEPDKDADKDDTEKGDETPDKPTKDDAEPKKDEKPEDKEDEKSEEDK